MKTERKMVRLLPILVSFLLVACTGSETPREASVTGRKEAQGESVVPDRAPPKPTGEGILDLLPDR